MLFCALNGRDSCVTPWTYHIWSYYIVYYYIISCIVDTIIYKTTGFLLSNVGCLPFMAKMFFHEHVKKKSLITLIFDRVAPYFFLALICFLETFTFLRKDDMANTYSCLRKTCPNDIQAGPSDKLACRSWLVQISRKW